MHVPWASLTWHIEDTKRIQPLTFIIKAKMEKVSLPAKRPMAIWTDDAVFEHKRRSSLAMNNGFLSNSPAAFSPMFEATRQSPIDIQGFVDDEASANDLYFSPISADSATRTLQQDITQLDILAQVAATSANNTPVANNDTKLSSHPTFVSGFLPMTSVGLSGTQLPLSMNPQTPRSTGHHRFNSISLPSTHPSTPVPAGHTMLHTPPTSAQYLGWLRARVDECLEELNEDNANSPNTESKSMPSGVSKARPIRLFFSADGIFEDPAPTIWGDDTSKAD